MYRGRYLNDEAVRFAVVIMPAPIPLSAIPRIVSGVYPLYLVFNVSRQVPVPPKSAFYLIVLSRRKLIFGPCVSFEVLPSLDLFEKRDNVHVSEDSFEKLHGNRMLNT